MFETCLNFTLDVWGMLLLKKDDLLDSFMAWLFYIHTSLVTLKMNVPERKEKKKINNATINIENNEI